MSKLENSRPTGLTISGVPEGFEAFLLAKWQREFGGCILHVVRDDKRLQQLCAALDFFSPQTRVVNFPAWDCPPYSKISPSPAVSAQRMEVLANVLTPVGVNEGVYLTTVNAIIQRLPPRSQATRLRLSMAVGKRVQDGHLAQRLEEMGYTRTSVVTDVGDFAIRGGIIDVFSPSCPLPVRLDFFGDILDGVRQFDPATQLSVGKLDGVDFTAISEIMLDETSIARFRKGYRSKFGVPCESDQLYRSVSEGMKFPGMEHWLPLFYAEVETIFDYFPNVVVSLDSGIEELIERKWESLLELYSTRVQVRQDSINNDTSVHCCAPSFLYLSLDELWNFFENCNLRKFSHDRMPTGLSVLDAGGRVGHNFLIERKQEKKPLIQSVVEYIQSECVSNAVVLACWSAGSRYRLRTLLEDHGMGPLELIESNDDISDRKGYVGLAVWKLERGFHARGITFISEQDIFGDKLVKPAKRKSSIVNFLSEARGWQTGELIVHADHGIGRYLGLVNIVAANAPHDCIALEYAGKDRLYVPVENLELLSRYGAQEASLDRLGAAQWQERKARLRKRIRVLAEDLLATAAARAVRSAPAISPNEINWDYFVASFQFEETEDQRTAVEDILIDLGSGTPMDRLICGDVGFGKTEIAMRAAFLVAMTGYQVALVAPTTLLVRQHFDSFKERFQNFPLRIAQLSRFSRLESERDVKKGLADGTVDVVIGTHALLGKSVKYKRLGLIVVDEEHSFGVAQKEYLKKLRSEAHVLTLTATPIPRTLQMALTGMRDLSLIKTPPADRLAIRTYVLEFDPLSVREALLREHFRGGQSFVVAPRIRDLPALEEFLSNQVPEINFATAHGKLSSRVLDERMNGFYDGRYDVLLSTTIVASGIDIPSANTIVICGAERFGLAQLYQIRGRVGRSGRRAYAFVTYSRRIHLTDLARRRLRLLGSLDSLGSGFSLAAHDLDIRGAGNLLGDEQSGHIREVGYELYQKLLNEAVGRMKSGKGYAEELGEGDWTPQLKLGATVMIPEHYVPDLEVRLGLYRRLATMTTQRDIEMMSIELIDRFGPLPPEVETLAEILKIKSLCKRANVSNLDAGSGGLTIRFHNNTVANTSGILTFVKKQPIRAKILEDRLVVRRTWKSVNARVSGTREIMCDLVKAVGESAEANDSPDALRV